MLAVWEEAELRSPPALPVPEIPGNKEPLSAPQCPTLLEAPAAQKGPSVQGGMNGSLFPTGGLPPPARP